MKIKTTIHAFIAGFVQFRSNSTPALNEHLLPCYDTGRDLAHKLTLRYFEE